MCKMGLKNCEMVDEFEFEYACRVHACMCPSMMLIANQKLPFISNKADEVLFFPTFFMSTKTVLCSIKRQLALYVICWLYWIFFWNITTQQQQNKKNPQNSYFFSMVISIKWFNRNSLYTHWIWSIVSILLNFLFIAL